MASPFNPSRELGKRGEALAWNFLIRQGYRILEKNYRNRLGEVDVVAQKEGTITFIEVKTRKDERFGLPAEAVNWKKRRKLVLLAEAYLQQKGLEHLPARFDILSITWDGEGEPSFSLIPDAFGADGG